MADEANEESVDGGAGGDRPLAGAALKSALEKERKERKELEKTVKALQQQVDSAETEREAAKKAAEDASKSEIDKLRDEVQNIRGERDQERAARESAEKDRERVERIRSHAGEFDNPDAVVAILRGTGKLDAVDDDDAAKRVLAELKTSIPRLLKPDTTLTGLEQVLRNGELQTKQTPAENGVFTPADARSIVPFETLNKMNADQLAALQQRDRGLYERSMNALSGYDADGMKIVVQ